MSDWPPQFPHLAIDDLVERLERASELDVEEACALLGLIAKEAQRLRATVVRLSAAKLSEADREARTIVQDAVVQADTMRALGLTALNDRLDEADHLLAGMREAFATELRTARAGSRAPSPRRPRADRLRIADDPGDERS